MEFLKDSSIIDKAILCPEHFIYIIKEKFKKLISNISVNKEIVRIFCQIFS
jgi:hypothetical protein